MLADRHRSDVAQALRFPIRVRVVEDDEIEFASETPTATRSGCFKRRRTAGPEWSRIWNDGGVTAELANGIVVRRVGPGSDVAGGLADVLVDCVAGGASVSFMLPLERERAEGYWLTALDSASRGERIVLVAEEEGTGVLVGTVQVLLTAPENQPHRGEIAKMLVHRRARRRGVAEALMRAVEAAALEAGKTLLVLDTSSVDAERLYDRLGWQRVGVIPGYALWPAGGLVDTTVFYKNLG